MDNNSDNKSALLANASQVGDRRSAVELLTAYEKHIEYIQHHERNKVIRPTMPGEADKHKKIDYGVRHSEDYEPTL